jgi:hypothetical protein
VAVVGLLSQGIAKGPGLERHLAHHLAVLAGEHHPGAEDGGGLEGPDHRRQLDGFRPRAKHDRDQGQVAGCHVIDYIEDEETRTSKRRFNRVSNSTQLIYIDLDDFKK